MQRGVAGGSGRGGHTVNFVLSRLERLLRSAAGLGASRVWCWLQVEACHVCVCFRVSEEIDSWLAAQRQHTAACAHWGGALLRSQDAANFGVEAVVPHASGVEQRVLALWWWFTCLLACMCVVRLFVPPAASVALSVLHVCGCMSRARGIRCVRGVGACEQRTPSIVCGCELRGDCGGRQTTPVPMRAGGGVCHVGVVCPLVLTRVVSGVQGPALTCS